MSRSAALARSVQALVLLLAAVGCTAKQPGPQSAADAFVSAFARADFAAAAACTDQPDRARAALANSWSGLSARGLAAHTEAAQTSGDTATVDYRYDWRLPQRRGWSYTGTLRMGRRDGTWSVRWASTDINPRLGDDQTLVLRVQPTAKAKVMDSSGGDVLVPGVVHAVLLDAARTGTARAAGVADRLAAALSPFDATLTGQSIAESATAAAGGYRVAALTDDQLAQVRQQLSALPGVTVVDQADLVPTDPAFAPAVLAQVRADVADDLGGRAGWSVVTQNPDGAEDDVLTETPARPAPWFTLSLDHPVQDAAQRAVDQQSRQAVMVIVRPSTGAILALAQNGAADAAGLPATTGEYPPGSTFKIVTAAAALETGMTPATTVPCPGTIVVGERTVPNENNFELGPVPLARAFAASCNTSFARLAGGLRPDALRAAAAQLGVLADYTVAGLPTASGSVPAAADLTVRTEDGFGQGRVVVTPFAMAMAAATVAHGSAPPAPYLIDAHPTAVAGDVGTLPPAAVDGLRAMMRQVVTDGTGKRIADQGEVYGKTGEAEFDGGSHAWFVGYRGDLAFATLIVGGGDSDNAVLLTRAMFAALPAGY